MSKLYLNNDWYFTETFTEDLLRLDLNTDALVPVRIPHTNKLLPYHYFSEDSYQMLCGYRKTLFAPDSWRGKKVLLTFEGAAHKAAVFINGMQCAEHCCGYTAFTADISEFLLFNQENIITVRLDTREASELPPFGHVIDYMTYGGIYRDVYIDVKEKNNLNDVFHQADMYGNLKTDICIDGDLIPDLTIRQRIILNETVITETQIPVQRSNISFAEKVENVRLWETENPVLYTIETALIQNEHTLDVYATKIGFRSVHFKKDGFYLNGRKLKIRGLNRHQSYPYVGYAMPASMQIMDADILKYELGLNAVRTSHYPQSHHFINRCDEIGLLVFTEIPGWQHIGNDIWKKQAIQNTKEMVTQYRNHPSIILWGVRINESADDDAFYSATNAIAHSLDPSRQTGGVRCIKGSHLLEDVYTYNDFIHDGHLPGCEKKHRVTSDNNKPYLISEYNGHMFPTKSFDCEEHRVEHALRHARVLDSVAANKDIAGSFGWCMTDYNTHKDFGSGDRICYHGVMDMFRNPKLAACVYACDQENDTVLEVASSMDIGEHPASRRGEVWVFTNADSIKMYKNERFIKEYIPASNALRHMKFSPILINDYIGDAICKNEAYSKMQAKFIAEVLNHVALYGYNCITPRFAYLSFWLFIIYRMSRQTIVDLYTKYVGDWGGTSTSFRFDAIKNGKIVKTVVKCPMNKAAFSVIASSNCLIEDTTYDVASIRIKAVDENNNILPYFMEPVGLSVTGPIEIIGPDTVSFKGGMTGTYIKSKGTPGEAALKLTNSYLGTTEIFFEVIC